MEELLTQREDHDREKTAKDEEEEKQECHQTFKTSTYEQYKNINPNRVEGTCRWVLENSHYRYWRQSSHNDLLWVSADPGCGKSVLAKSLVDGDLNTSDSVSICYFFFKDNDDQNSFTTALCAILHQLFGMQPDLLRHALPEWRKNGKNIQQEVDTLWRIFEAAFSDDASSSIICVIDALDECRPRDQAKLIKLLTNFYTRSQLLKRPNWIKFLVTSRPYLEIQEGFHSATKLFPRIHIRGEEENEQIHDEINLIVKLRVRELGQIEGLGTQTLQRIEKQLLQMEHRTCLWLQLAMDDIHIMFRDSFRPEEEMIQLIPSSVDAAYEKILSRAPPARQPEVKTILQIIVGARRPLHIEEMAVALGVGLEIANSEDLRSAAISKLKAEGLAEKIRHLCGLFVFIDKSKRIFLIHQTAREFLVNISVTEERILAVTELQFKEVVPDRVRKWYHTTLAEANLLLFKVCLAHLTYLKYLTYRTAEELNKVRRAVYHKNNGGYLEGNEHELLRKFSQYSFLDYSLDELENHAVASSSSPPKDLLDLAIKLNISPILRDIWLIQAAKDGQKDITMMLLENGADVNIQYRHGRTPLGWAVCERRKEIATLLLDNGANIEIQDSRRQSPLWVAAGLGEADLVRLLVTRGADINATAGGFGSTALQEAVRKDLEAMVKLLIELGAEIEAKERFSGASALWLAADRGQVAMVKLLMKLGANIDAKDGKRGETPLWRAVQEKNETMVKLLVELGADIEVRDDERGLTPLLWAAAAYNADETIVKLLVELGADIEAKDPKWDLTPLSRAVFNNRKRMVKLLIESHADIESKDERYGMPPLWWAALTGHRDIVKFLVKMGADTKSKNKRGSTILSWAAGLEGRESLVKLLVEMGCTDDQR